MFMVDAAGKPLRLTALAIVDDACGGGEDDNVHGRDSDRTMMDLAVGSSAGDVQLVTMSKDRNGRIVLTNQRRQSSMTRSDGAVNDNSMIYALVTCRCDGGHGDHPSKEDDDRRRRIWIGHASGLESWYQ
jgi:hypothetical protein